MKRVLTSLVVVAWVCVATPAFGDLQSHVYGTVTVDLNNVYGPTLGTSAGSGTGGPYEYLLKDYVQNPDWDGTQTNLSPNLTAQEIEGNKLGFCIELTETIGWSDIPGFEIMDLGNVPTLTDAQGTDIAKLWSLYESSGGTLDQNVDEYDVALQAAFWEVVQETEAAYDIAAGAFSMTSWGSYGDAAEVATSWFANLGSATAATNVVALYHPTRQNQSVVITRDQSVVPAPSALAGLISMAVMGLVVAWRKRGRR